MFSRIVLIILTLIAVGLYIRVILPAGTPTSLEAHRNTQVAASGERTASAESPATVLSSGQPATLQATATLEPLPAEQMRLVLETLAPELMTKKP